MPLLRRVIFYLFLLLYLIVCPVTILYALGYVFEPGTVHGVQKAGLISLATVPPGATVSMNGQLYGEVTPTVIRGLLPGAYDLTLTLKGYQPWARSLPVEVEKATVLEKIMLQPIEPEPRKVLAGPFTELVAVPGTRFLLLMAGRLLEHVTVYDRESDESWPLIPAASSFLGGHLDWSLTLKDSPFLLCYVTFPAGPKFLGIELNKGRARVTDLTGLFAGHPQRIAWDPRAAHHVFSLHDDGVDRLDTDGMALYPRTATQVRGLGVYDGALYLVRDDGTLQRMDLDGKRTEDLTEDPALSQRLANARGPWQVSGLSSNVLLLLSEDGELLLNRPPYRVAAAGVRGFEFDADRDRVLFWLRDKVGVLDLSHPAFDVRWVLEDGHDIAQASWVYDGSHILLRDGAAVSLVEAETYGAPARAPLVRVRGGTSVAYAETSGRLYYVDGSGALRALELLPGKESRFMRR